MFKKNICLLLFLFGINSVSYALSFYPVALYSQKIIKANGHSYYSDTKLQSGFGSEILRLPIVAKKVYYALALELLNRHTFYEDIYQRKRKLIVIPNLFYLKTESAQLLLGLSLSSTLGSLVEDNYIENKSYDRSYSELKQANIELAMTLGLHFELSSFLFTEFRYNSGLLNANQAADKNEFHITHDYYQAIFGFRI